MIRLLRFHPAWVMQWWIGIVVIGTSASAAYDVTMRGATVWQPNDYAHVWVGTVGLIAGYFYHGSLTSPSARSFWGALPLSPAALRRFKLLGFVLIAITGTLALPLAMAVAAALGAAVPVEAVWRWLAPLEAGLLWIVMSQRNDEPMTDGMRILAVVAVAGWIGAYRYASGPTVAFLAIALLIAIGHWMCSIRGAEAGAVWPPTSAPNLNRARDSDRAPGSDRPRDKSGWAAPGGERGVFTIPPSIAASGKQTGAGRSLLNRLCWSEVSLPPYNALLWPFLLSVGTHVALLQIGSGRIASSAAFLFLFFTPLRWSLGHTSRLAALPISTRRLFAFAVLPHFGWMVLGALPQLLWADGGILASPATARSAGILVILVIALLVQLTGRGALGPINGTTWRSYAAWLKASPFPWLAGWFAIALFVPPLPQSDGTSLSVDAVVIHRMADLLPANRAAAFAIVLTTAAAGYGWAERRFARNVEAVTYAFDAWASPEMDRRA